MNLIGKKTIFALFILIIIFYGIFRTQNFRDGPVIYLNNTDFVDTIESEYKFNFETKNIDEMYINGKKVFLDTEGNVDHKITLFDGLNEVEIRFIDKYKKEGIRRITIFKKQK